MYLLLICFRSFQLLHSFSTYSVPWFVRCMWFFTCTMFVFNEQCLWKCYVQSLIDKLEVIFLYVIECKVGKFSTVRLPVFLLVCHMIRTLREKKTCSKQWIFKLNCGQDEIQCYKWFMIMLLSTLMQKPRNQCLNKLEMRGLA